MVQTAQVPAGVSSPPRPAWRWHALLAVVLLLLQFALQLQLAREDSQTTDEGIHLTAGYSYWEWGSFALNPEHPPLVKLLSGGALRLTRPRFPAPAHPELIALFNRDTYFENHALADDFLYNVGNDPDRLLFAARVPAALLTLLLGVTVFCTSRLFFGPAAALLATLLYVLEPTIAGHGHLVTTDIAMAFGGVLFLLAIWRCAASEHPLSTVLVGLAFGVASLCKFTSIIFIPIALALLCHLRGLRWVVGAVPRLLAASVLAWLVVLAGYGFSLERPPDPLWAVSAANAGPVSRLATRAAVVVRRYAVPRDYFKGLGMVVGHAHGGHPSFLLGENNSRGRWYYFPVVFAAKTPLPLLVLILMALAISARRGRLRDPAHTYWLIAAGVYTACAMLSRANLGLRHLLPGQVLLLIWVSGLAEAWPTSARLRAATALLLVWLAVDFARTYPYYLGYYNEVVGERGYMVATDSNLDWGQDAKRIRRYLDEHPEIVDPWVGYGWSAQTMLRHLQVGTPGDEETPSPSRVVIVGASTLSYPPFHFLRQRPIADRITPGVFLFHPLDRSR